MFEWVFSEFLKTRSPYAFKQIGVSEKTVYSWCYPPHLPHARKNPLDRAVEVLDVIFEYEPSLGHHALEELVNRYGYRLEKLSEDKDPSLSELHKEVTEFLQAEVEAREDGKITPEEARRILRELQEAELLIARRKARLKAYLKQIK